MTYDEVNVFCCPNATKPIRDMGCAYMEPALLAMMFCNRLVLPSTPFYKPKLWGK